MQIHLSALGCRLNEAELELWAGEFRSRGHQLVTQAIDADVMVVNTCAVTQEAVRKSRKSITRLQRDNPLAKMVVSGCFVSLGDNQTTEQLATELGVDLVVHNSHKDQLVRHAHDALDLTVMPRAATEPATPALFSRQRHRAFVKIQDGCRYRCTFCVVTMARGEERSRTEADIIDEVNQLADAGVKEIVLTGVHVGGYGSDLGSNLMSLVQALLTCTDVPRIRFASVEPWDLPDDFITLFENPRLMPHMHLPLQSGSDTVLRRMARRCKTAAYTTLVRQLREAIPGFNVTTDIIAGFPGETDDEWQQTMDYVSQTGFGHIHIFTYSARSGTRAASLPGQLTGDVKKARSRELHQLAAALKTESMLQLSGAELPVLWEKLREQPDGTRRCHGYTPNYHRVSTTLQPDADSGPSPPIENRIIPTRIGKLIDDPSLPRQSNLATGRLDSPVLEGYIS